jgi:phage replication-related protein YjqB (UPF0714/DUF867 family)
MDKYSCFEELSAHEAKGFDYEVRRRRGRSAIAVLSIHGGRIELGTSEIADAIAGADHSFYTFRGIKRSGNRDLHLTSTTFDEPSALEIVCRSETIISIHGITGQEELVQVGGLDSELRRCIEAKLRLAGFKAPAGSWSFYRKSEDGRPVSCTTATAEEPEKPFRIEMRLRGLDKRNICNRSRRARGVQLEISKGLRATLLRSLSDGAGTASESFPWFIQAVREAMEPFKIQFETATR